MSDFSPEAFLGTSVKGANATRVIPVPEGDYPAIVKSLKPRLLDDGRLIIDLVWSVDDEKVREATKMKEPTVRQSLFVDRNGSGQLATGEGVNVQVGRVREALGQNDPTKEWNFHMLEGQAARITVKHRLVDGEIFSDVKGVTKL